MKLPDEGSARVNSATVKASNTTATPALTLVRGGRRRRLKTSRTWPWADAIATAWARITALPQAP